MASNLACLCRRHHRWKTVGRWRVRHLGGGLLEWTTPRGEVLTTEPAGAALWLTDTRAVGTADLCPDTAGAVTTTVPPNAAPIPDDAIPPGLRLSDYPRVLVLLTGSRAEDDLDYLLAAHTCTDGSSPEEGRFGHPTYLYAPDPTPDDPRPPTPEPPPPF